MISFAARHIQQHHDNMPDRYPEKSDTFRQSMQGDKEHLLVDEHNAERPFDERLPLPWIRQKRLLTASLLANGTLLALSITLLVSIARPFRTSIEQSRYC